MRSYVAVLAFASILCMVWADENSTTPSAAASASEDKESPTPPPPPPPGAAQSASTNDDEVEKYGKYAVDKMRGNFNPNIYYKGKINSARKQVASGTNYYYDITFTPTECSPKDNKTPEEFDKCKIDRYEYIGHCNCVLYVPLGDNPKPQITSVACSI